MNMVLKVLLESDIRLSSTKNAHIASNYYLGQRIILNNGDISTLPITANVYQISEGHGQQVIFSVSDDALVSSVTVSNELNHELQRELICSAA